MIPNLLNIESLDELMCKRVLTPMTNEENEYMVVKKRLLSIYAEDQNPNESQILPEEGEPGLLFHEFIILLGVIAIECNGTHGIDYVEIENFFIEKLGFKKVPEEQRKFKTFDDYLKKKPGKKVPDSDNEDYEEEGVFTDDEGLSSDELCLDEKEKEFQIFLQKRAEKEAEFSIDLNRVLDIIEEICPEIPGKPEVQQIRTCVDPKEKAPVRLEFGKLMPPPPG